MHFGWDARPTGYHDRAPRKGRKIEMKPYRYTVFAAMRDFYSLAVSAGSDVPFPSQSYRPNRRADAWPYESSL